MTKLMREKRPVVGFILSLISAVFIALNGLIFAFFGTMVAMYKQIKYIAGTSEIGIRLFIPVAPIIYLFIAFGIICVVIASVGTYMIYMGRGKVGGTLVIIGSVMSLMIGGGFFMGFLLGVIGGALAIAGV